MSATCSSWNGDHDCGRLADHPGDHECVGCHDVWNRSDADDQADNPFFVEQRDHDHPIHLRCFCTHIRTPMERR